MPKKFSVEITNNQLQTFKEAINNSKEAEEEFIENYIAEHKEVKEISNINDVYSLFLIKAILKSDKDVTAYILSKVGKINILANIDKSGNSPIYTTLMFHDEQVLEVIRNYLKSYKGQLEKVEVPVDMLDNLVSVVSLSTAIRTYLDTYIRPVYSEESVSKIIEIIGEDNIYDATY